MKFSNVDDVYYCYFVVAQRVIISCHRKIFFQEVSQLPGHLYFSFLDNSLRCINLVCRWSGRCWTQNSMSISSRFYCLSLSLLSHHYFCYYYIKSNCLGRKLGQWRKLLFASWECFDIRPGIPHSQEDWLLQLSCSGDILVCVLWSKSSPEWVF